MEKVLKDSEINPPIIGGHYISKDSESVIKVLKIYEYESYLLVKYLIDNFEFQIPFSKLTEKYVNIPCFVGADIVKWQKELIKIEKSLNKCRTSSFVDGWQTQKHAKKSRKWDFYSEEKRKYKKLIHDSLDGVLY